MRSCRVFFHPDNYTHSKLCDWRQRHVMKLRHDEIHLAINCWCLGSGSQGHWSLSPKYTPQPPTEPLHFHNRLQIYRAEGCNWTEVLLLWTHLLSEDDVNWLQLMMKSTAEKHRDTGKLKTPSCPEVVDDINTHNTLGPVSSNTSLNNSTLKCWWSPSAVLLSKHWTY